MFILKRSQLLNFAYAILRVSQMKKYEQSWKKYKVEFNQDIKKIAGDMEGSLSQSILKDLEFLIKKYHICEMIIELGLEKPDMTADEFIALIKDLSIEAFRDFYRRYTFNIKSNNIDEIKKKIQQNERNNAVTVIPSYKDFLVFEKETDELLPRILQCLEAFNGVYRQFYSEINRLQLQQEEAFRPYIKDQERFAKDLFVVGSDVYDYKTMNVYVYIVLFQEGDLSFRRDMENIRLDMAVGCYLHKKYYNDDDIQLEFFKCLADPTKLKIIEMIAHERVCAIDIAKRLKLTKATISYHIGKLVFAGIIKIHMQEGKRAYYQVQEDVIRECFDGYLEGLRNK